MAAISVVRPSFETRRFATLLRMRTEFVTQ
jgi:hypothetical protein